MSINLKLCPLCGAKAEMKSAVGEYWVLCNGCNASAGLSSNENKSAEIWNRRVETEQEKVIKDFLTAMSTQDNRATAFPYFYVIRDFKYISAADGCGDVSEYISCEDAEHSITEEEYDNLPQTSNDEYCKEDFHRVCMQEIVVENEMFLTDTDAKNHLKANYYHYSSKAHTYVKHAFRAPELTAFFEALFTHFGVEIPR